jgi:hypothetical protein
MTIVYFHASGGRRAEILGAERRRMARLVRMTTEAVLDLRTPYQDALRRGCRHLRRFVDPSHYLSRGARFAEGGVGDDDEEAGRDEVLDDFARGFLDCLAIDSDEFLQWEGAPIGATALSLNTALAVGGDELRLAARIDAQCEIHGWVDGPHRGWIADVIERGLEVGLYRRSLEGHDLGWSSVVDLLRSSSEGEIVTSFSVGDRFPSADAARLSEEDFDAASPAERWALAVRHLREDEFGRLLEWRPDNWAAYRFEHGLSALDLVAEDWRARVEAKLGIPRDRRGGAT